MLDNPEAVISINDDEFHGKIRFTSSTFSEYESKKYARISLERVGGISGTIAIRVTPAPQTATGGTDYDATPIDITFNPGESEKIFHIRMIKDAHNETGETLSLNLSNAVVDGTPVLDAEGIDITHSSATLEIKDYASLCNTRCSDSDNRCALLYILKNNSKSLVCESPVDNNGNYNFSVSNPEKSFFEVEIIKNSDAAYWRKEIIHSDLNNKARDININIITTVSSSAIYQRIQQEGMSNVDPNVLTALKADYQAKISTTLASSIYSVTTDSNLAKVDDFPDIKIQKMSNAPMTSTSVTSYLWDTDSAALETWFKKVFEKNIVNGD